MTARPVSLVDEEGLRAGVERALDAHVRTLAQELEPLGADTAALTAALHGILTGGKRLRAAFCYWSWRAHGGGAPTGSAPERDAVLRIGAALELFQAAALFHDDVMDDSETRRGQPAAHVTFAETHRRRSWSGSAQRYGESAAILLGDLALVASEREFAAALGPLAPAAAGGARAVFDTMRTEVTVGQYLDVLAQTQPWADDPVRAEERARAVVRAKSARYSVEHPLALGAALAGAGGDALALCARVGLPLGEAFQLRDDLLGVFGDPAATGKPAGDDLREGKRTVLVARALGGADLRQREVLLAGLGRRDLTAEDVDRLREVLVATGAVASVEGLIDALASGALTALSQAPLAEPARTMLLRLGRAAVDRAA